MSSRTKEQQGMLNMFYAFLATLLATILYPQFSIAGGDLGYDSDPTPPQPITIYLDKESPVENKSAQEKNINPQKIAADPAPKLPLHNLETTTPNVAVNTTKPLAEKKFDLNNKKNMASPTLLSKSFIIPKNTIHYQNTVCLIAKNALKSNPNSIFRIISSIPSTGKPETSHIDMETAKNNVKKIVSQLHEMRVARENIHIAYKQMGNAQHNWVTISTE